MFILIRGIISSVMSVFAVILYIIVLYLSILSSKFDGIWFFYLFNYASLLGGQKILASMLLQDFLLEARYPFFQV